MQSVEKSYQLFRNNPLSKKYIHRLRVEMRKLRAALNFLKPIISEELYQSINNILKNLGFKLSPIRDLDTLIELTNSISEKNPKLLKNYANVFVYLEKERILLAQQNSQRKNISEFDDGFKKVSQMLSNLEFNLNNEEGSNFEEFIESRFLQIEKKVNKRYKRLDYTDYETVHELRKDAKKLRYAAISFKTILNAEIRKPVKKKTKKIQDELGKRTDAHVSTEILEQYKEKAKSIKLKGALQKLIDYKSDIEK